MTNTYMDDECWMVFLQFAPEPHKVLIAPVYLVFTGVKLTPRGLGIKAEVTFRLRLKSLRTR